MCYTITSRKGVIMEQYEEKIKLVLFDINNEQHLSFYKELRKDESIFKWFQGLLPNLLRKTDDIFNKGFLLSYNKELIGYMDISNYIIEEEAVYIRGAIEKEHRGKSLGKKMLKDITEYIFNNYSYIRFIKSKVNKNNIASIKMATNAGFKNIYNDYYIIENPFYDIIKKK